MTSVSTSLNTSRKTSFSTSSVDSSDSSDFPGFQPGQLGPHKVQVKLPSQNNSSLPGSPPPRPFLKQFLGQAAHKLAHVVIKDICLIPDHFFTAPSKEGAKNLISNPTPPVAGGGKTPDKLNKEKTTYVADAFLRFLPQTPASSENLLARLLKVLDHLPDGQEEEVLEAIQNKIVEILTGQEKDENGDPLIVNAPVGSYGLQLLLKAIKRHEKLLAFAGSPAPKDPSSQSEDLGLQSSSHSVHASDVKLKSSENIPDDLALEGSHSDLPLHGSRSAGEEPPDLTLSDDKKNKNNLDPKLKKVGDLLKFIEIQARKELKNRGEFPFGEGIKYDDDSLSQILHNLESKFKGRQHPAVGPLSFETISAHLAMLRKTGPDGSLKSRSTPEKWAQLLGDLADQDPALSFEDAYQIVLTFAFKDPSLSVGKLKKNIDDYLSKVQASPTELARALSFVDRIVRPGLVERLNKLQKLVRKTGKPLTPSIDALKIQINHLPPPTTLLGKIRHEWNIDSLFTQGLKALEKGNKKFAKDVEKALTEAPTVFDGQPGQGQERFDFFKTYSRIIAQPEFWAHPAANKDHREAFSFAAVLRRLEEIENQGYISSDDLAFIQRVAHFRGGLKSDGRTMAPEQIIDLDNISSIEQQQSQRIGPRELPEVHFERNFEALLTQVFTAYVPQGSFLSVPLSAEVQTDCADVFNDPNSSLGDRITALNIAAVDMFDRSTFPASAITGPLTDVQNQL